MVKVILLLSVCYSFIFSPLALALTKVTATVDKNPVMINESVVLTVVADDDVNTNALDTSSLLKDFIVGRTSVSSQTSMINFDTTRSTSWTTVLIPRKTGSVIIPTLTVDNFHTVPITLEVLAASDQQANQQQDLFITTEISSNNIYVQQQVTLLVKLHFATELKRGSLSEPTMENANITQVGKDNETETIIKGKRYRVIERTYAISPQQSGEFILNAPIFSGEVIMPSSRRSNFLSFSESKPVSVIGDNISLTVRPVPDNYQGIWLPSELVALHQEWQPDLNTFTVGEPITRTITLTAAGLSQEQLPELSFETPEGLKVYPDQAELHTGMNNNKLVSQKVNNFALVASKAGTYELPEIVIPWWNTVTNQYQQATIAKQTIVVLPNKNIPTNEPQSSGVLSSTAPVETVIVTKASWLQWLFLALWLLTSFAWFVSYRMSKVKVVKKISVPVRNTTPYLALMAACKQHQGEQALSLIVPWVNSLGRGNLVTTLDEAILCINRPDFTNAVNELQHCYYGKNNHDWQGNNLFLIITDIGKSKVTATPESWSLNP